METDRSEVVGERLEWQPVVARREPQLGWGDLSGRLDAGQLGSPINGFRGRPEILIRTECPTR